MNYESAPNCVSYEALLRVIEARPTVGKPYDERLYLAELSHRLSSLTRKTMKEIAKKWDEQSQF
ncbi:MAG: hypothetical protein JST89_20125 [Cyanobacteria bacterium SZAS-4]|nr:hypothetical protein [Cyanobacteria bacterium SZAS-4]